LTKDDCEKLFITEYDKILDKSISKVKYVPVLINYSVNKKRYEKYPDEEDLFLIEKIKNQEIKYSIPCDRMPEGDEARRNDRIGIENVHQFYTNRNLYVLSKFFEKINKYESKDRLLFILTSMLPKLTDMNRYMPQHGSRALVGPMANTLYIPPLFVENNCIDQYIFQQKKMTKALVGLKYSPGSVHSATKNPIKDCTIDYIFTDPPFGANIMYSELNYLSESWLKVKTNNLQEAIENKTQGKSKLDYQYLMTECFREYYRVLKPGKWMTVEFSNTSAAIWNAIQNAIQRAGFIISSVTAIDNTRGGLHAMLGPTAVKQNLIISCYKPSEIVTSRNADMGNLNIWQFIEEHLNHLPIHIQKDSQTKAIIERTPKILYDRLVTYYFMRGISIPLDSVDFQIGLKQKYHERDGMYFLPEQAAEYDEQKANYGEDEQLELIFDIIYSENDAIQYLKERLRKKPQTYQEIMPDFRKANVATRKGELELELKTILEENFITEENGKWRVPNLNEAKDRESLRNKSLMKEFNKYLGDINSLKIKKLKEVRVEALHAGFKSCWEKKDFRTIVNLCEKVPQNILLEDEQLLMYYDIAQDKI
jgi:16S rRNA G966 N2-methylase RsmD